MAEAKLLEAKKPDVELILTYDEAEFLFRLLSRHIYGDGKNGDLLYHIHFSLLELDAKFNTDYFDCDIIDVTDNGVDR